MNVTSMRRVAVPAAAALTLSLSLAACGSSSSGGSTSGGSTLSIGGSSAQGTAQTQWISDYQTQNSGVTITYNPVGSGAGRTSFESGAYPFAGSDAFIDPVAKATEYAAAKSHCGADPLEVPDYISPIAVVFNLKNVASLNLDATTIAKIFNGTIKTWNNPAITALNPGVTLPSTAIQPVHRLDDSGTTQNFTDYLSQASMGAWKSAASQTWPTTSGLNGKGTSGVVSAVQGADGSIGYVDASQAGGFGIVKVKVAGTYVEPTAAGAAADLENSKLDKSAKSDQLIFDVDRTPTSASSYPILLVSYLIGCPSYSNAATAKLVKGYMSYIVSAAGQASGSKAANSAPLPASLSAKATAIVSAIK